MMDEHQQNAFSADVWGCIAVDDWRDTPCTVGRIATDSDIERGSAVFAIGTGKPHQPFAMPLPRCGIEHCDDGTHSAVVVIQAEHFNGETFLGVRYVVGGGNSVCTISEVELLEEPNAAFRSLCV